MDASAFNRTYEELKCKDYTSAGNPLFAFNRTYEELK